MATAPYARAGHVLSHPALVQSMGAGAKAWALRPLAEFDNCVLIKVNKNKIK
jgi:hypothetical protein